MQDHDDIYIHTLEKWGYNAQMDVVIEELSELIKAIIKYRREPTIERAIDMAEELGDVIIMTRQLEIAMAQKYPEFVAWKSDTIQTKLHRIKSRLNDQP